MGTTSGFSTMLFPENRCSSYLCPPVARMHLQIPGFQNKVWAGTSDWLHLGHRALVSCLGLRSKYLAAVHPWWAVGCASYSGVGGSFNLGSKFRSQLNSRMNIHGKDKCFSPYVVVCLNFYQVFTVSSRIISPCSVLCVLQVFSHTSSCEPNNLIFIVYKVFSHCSLKQL